MYSFKQIAFLIVCTAGTVIYLFLLTLFAGLRRRKPFEVALFLTGIALFLVYAGRLLQLNTDLYYDSVAAAPFFSLILAGAIGGLGNSLLPALLVHAHFEYWRRLNQGRTPRWPYSVVGLFYLPAVFSLILWTRVLLTPDSIGRDAVRSMDVWLFQPWFALAFFLSAVMELRFARGESRASFSQLHMAIATAFMVVLATRFIPHTPGWIFYLALLVPGALLGYHILRDRFLPLGVQRNLVITVTLGFLALLYLTLAQRISEWLEPAFPPIATRSILIFVLVLFFDPLQRRVGNLLQHTLRREAEKLQRLTAEIQQIARVGELEEVVPFVETRIAETLALPRVRIVLQGGPDRPATTSGPVQRFVLREGANEIGVLEAHYYGQTLSGETHAALEYLAEQLPAALDLCRLIQGKLRLERELAERQRFALLGQMAASVSHNLRNPLGSMKTLLQVQLESPELPAAARDDIRRVVAEIDQLSAKLTQLLQYSKPSVRSGVVETAEVNVTAHLRQAVALLKPEAERRHIKLQENPADTDLIAHGTDEAVHDIVSNLLVNALEAVAEGGTVRVAATARDRFVVLDIADDGPGIPADVRGRIFEPFFTTKPRGTGLGLAIVQKRLDEIGGRIECESPLKNGRGTLFRVSLPRARAPEV